MTFEGASDRITTVTMYTAKQRILDLDVLSTLPELLTHHLDKRPDAVAYQFYDPKAKRWLEKTFKEAFEDVLAWRKSFAAFPFLERGDRCAMLLPNCYEAVCFDQSMLADAFVPVPLHAIDTPKSSGFILRDSGAKVLVTNKLLKWKLIREACETPDLRLVVITDDEIEDDPSAAIPVMKLSTFLTLGRDVKDLPMGPKADDLAALVYTSGTTGNPKGVMLTHRNVLSNLRGTLANISPHDEEQFLSFLPLSHTFERTASYYLALGLGYPLAFNRSIAHLTEDFKIIRPTVLLSVPRVYEMVYAKLRDGLAKKSGFVRFLFNWAVNVGWRSFCSKNGIPCERPFSSLFDPLVAGFLDRKVGKTLRDVFGGRPHLYISGGAALSPAVSKIFCALGIPVMQGYGMTETSPVIAVNRQDWNHPSTVGPLVSNLEGRLSEDGELQVRGPSVMKGYWNRPDATKEIFTADGWLRTGDVCEIYDDGYIRITGRIKEIIVTSTGEKVPPADLEAAIQEDPLFAQAMVLGDDRPFISAITVVNPDVWTKFCEELGLDPADPASLKSKEAKTAALRRIKHATRGFPNYGVPRQVTLLTDDWSIESGFLTPTLKLKRRVVMATYAKEIEEMYEALERKGA